VRRITVELDQPTRDGDRTIHILTNLPAATADAVQVAALTPVNMRMFSNVTTLVA
jgi:hypothetical protein